MMASGQNPFHTANAWEKWWLGWMEPQEVTTNGTYILKDFMTEKDAIRIPIPHAPDHYLWIENHQLLHKYESKLFYDHTSLTQPGVFMYITSIGPDCSSPSDVTYSKANTFKLVHANGKHDIVWDYQTTENIPGAYSNHPVLELSEENPISGQHVMNGIRFDFDNNGLININTNENGGENGGTNEHKGVWAELDNSNIEITYAKLGDNRLGFKVGDKVGLSGTLPVLNFPYYNHSLNVLEPYNLNGLKVKIESYDNVTGEYEISVNFNDWEISEDKRWTGDIILPENEELVIKQNKTLTINKTGTPNRHIVDQTHGFFNPTNFYISENSSLILEENSNILIDDYSTIHLEDLAYLKLKSGSEIIIENDGHLILRSGSQTLIKSNSKIIIEAGGKMTIEEGANLTIENHGQLVIENSGRLYYNEKGIMLDGNDATLVVKGWVEVRDNMDFDFNGTGYVDLHMGNNFIFGNNSHFYIKGPDKNHRVMKIQNDASLTLRDFRIDDGRVEYGTNSQVYVDGGKVILNRSGLIGSGTSKGIHAKELEYFYITNSLISNHEKGVELYDMLNEPAHFARIKNTEFYNSGSNISLHLEDVSMMEIVGSEFHRSGHGLSGTGILAENVPLLKLKGTEIRHLKYGIEAIDVTQLSVSHNSIDKFSTIEENEVGIYATRSNVFLRNRTRVQNNETGIYMEGEGTESHMLTIGDLGCAWVIDNFYNGVEGSDFLFDIDSEEHAMAAGYGNFVSPNRFDSEGTIFNVCYDDQYINPTDTILAKKNYWGLDGSVPMGLHHSLNDYRININDASPCNLGTNIYVNDDNYVSIEESICPVSYLNGPYWSINQYYYGQQLILQDINLAHQDTMESNINFIANTGCGENMPSSSSVIGEVFSYGYRNYLAGLGYYNTAKENLYQVAALDINNYLEEEKHSCLHLIRKSRVLVGIIDSMLLYDVDLDSLEELSNHYRITLANSSESKSAKTKEENILENEGTFHFTINPNPTDGFLTRIMH